MKLMRWRLEVTGWRYTRRWVIGIRRGEWWIGWRHNFQADWTEIGVLGLTVCIPAEKEQRRSVRPPSAYFVPAGEDRCPQCRDINYELDTRLCITCTYGGDGYRGGQFRAGWPDAKATLP